MKGGSNELDIRYKLMKTKIATIEYILSEISTEKAVPIQSNKRTFNDFLNCARFLIKKKCVNKNDRAAKPKGPWFMWGFVRFSQTVKHIHIYAI